MSKNKNILQNGTTRYAFRKLEKDQNDGFEYLVTPSYIDKKGNSYDFNWTFNNPMDAMEFLKESIVLREVPIESNEWYLVQIQTSVLFKVKDKQSKQKETI
ncbi:MAG: hypothetical protein WC240_06970 [Bacilli bacterium]